MLVSEKWVSLEEGLEFIQNDMGKSILEDHPGFLSDSELPFRPPKHYKNDIIIWEPADIHPGAKIGNDVVIGRYTNICGAISIGHHTRIQGFCFIPDAVEIGSYVFIGPNVVFTNKKYPKVRHNQMKERDGKTIIEDGVSIGAGAVICPGVRIGENTLIGAGAVVTKDIPADVVVIGTPANIINRSE